MCVCRYVWVGVCAGVCVGVFVGMCVGVSGCACKCVCRCVCVGVRWWAYRYVKKNVLSLVLNREVD